MIPDGAEEAFLLCTVALAAKSFGSLRSVQPRFHSRLSNTNGSQNTKSLERDSLEDADHLRRFQRHSHDSGGMLRSSDLERRNKTGERLPC